MARLPRLCPAGIPLHVVQRGNNRDICFVREFDYQQYLFLLGEGARACGVEVHAWVLMTNHVHLLATSKEDGNISRMMQYVGRNYVRYFNKQYSRSGTLWEGRFKSCLVDNDAYFLTCQRYIELNPVRANMVEDPAQYRWSSYLVNAFGISDDLVIPHVAYLSLANTAKLRRERYIDLFSESLEKEVMEQ